MRPAREWVHPPQAVDLVEMGDASDGGVPFGAAPRSRLGQRRARHDGAAHVFFEGDDLTTVDGELVIHGTGSEDSFNGGWYDVPGRWDGPVALPLGVAVPSGKAIAGTPERAR